MAKTIDPASSKPEPPSVSEPDREVLVTISQRSKAGAAVQLDLVGEVIDERAAAELGWRSMRSRVLVACDRRMNEVQTLTVFSQHDRRGEARRLSPPQISSPQTWLRPAPRAYMSDVIVHVCGKDASRGSEIAAGSPASQKSIGTLVQAPVTPLASAPRSHRLEPPSPSVQPATFVRPNLASSSAASTPRPSIALVQLAAASSQGEAEALLARVKARFGGAAQMSSTVQQALVKGRTLYRAQLTGFQTVSEATGVCARLKQSGQACFVKGVQ